MIRRGKRFRYSVFSAVLLAASCLAAADETLLEPRGVIASNQYVEVLADDMLSAQYVATVGEMFGRRFSRMLPLPAGALQPVFIHLVSTPGDGFSAPFLTRIHASGQVNVSIAWGANTTREVMERALVQGHLTYLSGAYSAGSFTVPLWLELAALHLTRVQAVPAHGHFLATRILAAGPMRLESILTAERDQELDDDLGANAYWLLAFLEREGRSRGQFQHFLIRVLRGESPAKALNATYGEHLRSSSEAQLWWLVGVNEMVRAPGSPMPTAEESRTRVKALSRFSFVFEGEEIRLFPEDLWQYRTSASLREELRHRIAVTRMELAAMHPYYHNVLFSLERLFDAVLASDQEAFHAGVAAVRHDLRTGDELMEDTRSVLDDLAAELSGG